VEQLNYFAFFLQFTDKELGNLVPEDFFTKSLDPKMRKLDYVFPSKDDAIYFSILAKVDQKMTDREVNKLLWAIKGGINICYMCISNGRKLCTSWGIQFEYVFIICTFLYI